MAYTYYSLYNMVDKEYVLVNTSIKDIAEYLGITPQTCYNSRHNGFLIEGKYEIQIYDPELHKKTVPKPKKRHNKPYRVSSSSLYYPD